jgi:hypothetical protein
MEANGICRRSKSQWFNPLHIVPKADGTFRPCGNYRRLNGLNEQDSYPIPHIQDFGAWLAGKRIFSTINLVKGYHQIPICAKDISKTPIVTSFGLFKFLRVPFGFSNAAQGFQELIDEVLAGLPFVFVYLDDILVASLTRTQHKQYLEAVFDCMVEHGLVTNAAICRFAQTSLEFLRHVVSADGVKPIASHVEAIRNFEEPKTVGDLQRYNGLIKYYHRFVPKIAEVMIPFFNMLKGKPKRNATVIWLPVMRAAFTRTKNLMADATALVHPQSVAPIGRGIEQMPAWLAWGVPLLHKPTT